MGQYKDPEYKKKYYHRNKAHILAKCKKWAEENSDKVTQIKRNWKLRNQDKVKEYNKTHPKKYRPKRERVQHLKRYKITLEQYDQMLEKQNYVCIICGGVNKDGRRLFVDHDHKTGKIRGLLCNCCNRGLGSFHDSTTNLHRAILYLSEDI